jgi:hypothetical protein
MIHQARREIKDALKPIEDMRSESFCWRNTKRIFWTYLREIVSTLEALAWFAFALQIQLTALSVELQQTWNASGISLRFKLPNKNSIAEPTGLLDFIHRPEFQNIRKHNVSETGSVSVFRWGERDTHTELTPSLMLCIVLRLWLKDTFLVHFFLSSDNLITSDSVVSNELMISELQRKRKHSSVETVH